MRTKRAILLAVAVAALGLSCTNKEGETEAPVFITVTQTGTFPGFFSVTLGPPGFFANTAAVQIGTMTLNSRFKNPTATDPQHFADVNLEQYVVTFQRLDGGTKVPPPQKFTTTAFLPSGGTATLTNFPILPGGALLLSPFDQLQVSGGGIDRETGQPIIRMAYFVTFFGHTVSGLRIQSETMTGYAEFTQ